MLGIIQEQGMPPRICRSAFWECFWNVGSLWGPFGIPPPAAPTVPGAILDLPGDPGHGLGTHLSAKIPVKGGGAASLRQENPG